MIHSTIDSLILVPETDFTQAMVAHETALVHITVDTDNAPLGSVLPHGVVTIVGQHGSLFGIHSNHQLIVVYLSQQMLVIEIAEGIEQRLLVVGFLNEVEEIEQRVAEDVRRQPSRQKW